MNQFKYLEKGDPEICNQILRSLPDWFGIETAIADYVNESKKLPMLIAIKEDTAVGFLSLKKHSEHCSEILVMGVLPNFHGQGLGSTLLVEAERLLAQQGVEFLQVKTLGESNECSFYKKTRLFYRSHGFREIEVFPTLWGDSNPCLLMVKSVSPQPFITAIK